MEKLLINKEDNQIIGIVSHFSECNEYTTGTYTIKDMPKENDILLVKNRSITIGVVLFSTKIIKVKSFPTFYMAEDVNTFNKLLDFFTVARLTLHIQ